jgi:hypothetical protein
VEKKTLEVRIVGFKKEEDDFLEGHYGAFRVGRKGEST